MDKERYSRNPWKHADRVEYQSGTVAESERAQLFWRIWAGAVDSGNKIYGLGDSQWLFDHKSGRTAEMD